MLLNILEKNRMQKKLINRNRKGYQSMFPVNNVATEAFVILSSDFDENTTVKILQDNNVSFKMVQGVYKGITEKSYVVNFNDAIKTQDLTKNQHSVLILDAIDDSGLRPASLQINPRRESGIPEAIIQGLYFKSVTKEYALSKDAYTYDPIQDQYFVVE
jgi:hypothetical protein